MLARKPAIIRRATERYGIVGGIPPDFVIPNSIQLIGNADSLLMEPKILEGVVDLSGTHYNPQAIHTVPVGQRWHVTFFYRSVSTVATRVYVADPAGELVFLQGETTSEGVIFPGTPILLDPGWVVGMIKTGDVGDAARQQRILFMLEDISST